MGAALGQVSGSVDRIVTLDSDDRDASWERAQQQCKEEATSYAVAAGAEPGSVEVVDVNEVPVPYVGSSGMAVRMRVRVVGDLQGYGQPTTTKGETQAKRGIAKVLQVSAVVDCVWEGRCAAVDLTDFCCTITSGWMITSQSCNPQTLCKMGIFFWIRVLIPGVCNCTKLVDNHVATTRRDLRSPVEPPSACFSHHDTSTPPSHNPTYCVGCQLEL